jgi:hypothetical protein
MSSAARRLALAGLVAAICVGLLLPASGAAGGQRGGDAFLVPTGGQAGFGAFREGPHAAARLRRALGTPTLEKDGAFSDCRMTWDRLGVAVELQAPPKAGDPCAAGSFVFARLTDPRWQTPSGIHPGSTRAAAAAASVLRCHAGTPSCGATGYALGLYRDCSGHLFTTVLAHPRGNRIAALNVYARQRCR